MANNSSSVIAAGMSIEGKIQGEGHMTLAGQFKGDVQVAGNLTVEPGAKLCGEIHAETVTINGEVEGNINATSHVKFLESGQLIGDLKAASLTVAAGSRMRGRVEFGWKEEVRERDLQKDLHIGGNGAV